MQKLLKRNEIESKLLGRTKGLFSLHRKMRRTNLSLEAVTDKIGMRIIVSSVRDCYTVLGLIHTQFQPIPGKFKDYIGLPKDNGYQSLHTCVYPVRRISHKPVEIQIRTEAMHSEAEYGVAAHWYYKTENDSDAENLRQLTWLRSLPAEHDTSLDREGFLNRLRDLVYSNEIIIFNDKGGRIRLPAGSSVRAFASGLGQSLSENMVVRVNGRKCSLETQLRDGDTVDLN
jgi:GTP pyrophosphokinase